jgi:hypothetical protein
MGNTLPDSSRFDHPFMSKIRQAAGFPCGLAWTIIDGEKVE